MRAVVVGAGAFGTAAALALRERGCDVVLIDRGAALHPQAASTDISKLIRADYGSDVGYTALMEDAWTRWLTLAEGPLKGLFHTTGWVALTTTPFEQAPSGFEAASFATLARRGHPVERVDATAIAARWPAWADAGYVDGYWNPHVAWADSAGVVRALRQMADARGVERRHTGVAQLQLTGRRCAGVVLTSGERVEADHVVVAAGAWSAALVPALASKMRANGQAVFHLAPAQPRRFAPPTFPAFAADVGRSGWYGFPLSPGGIVKVANHGPGLGGHPDMGAPSVDAVEASLRAFLRQRLPWLAQAPIVARRVCYYADSVDGDFWIGRVPDVDGLTVATGGSGHGFKLTPVLGELIANAALGVTDPRLARFAWRTPQPAAEAARAQ